jgi:hypothetical protein
MDFRENIKTHFKDKINGELQKITVDEWKIDVYYKQSYPFAVESKIISLQQQNKTVEAIVEAILLKSLDPDGKPLFKAADRNMMMFEADPAVLLKIATAINSATSDYEIDSKN